MLQERVIIAAYPFVFNVANVAQKLLEPKPGRRSAVFQNRGPGVVVINTKRPAHLNDGFLIGVNETLRDAPPGFVHGGEWWGLTDTVDTVLLVMEA